MSKITVILADDHAILRLGLRTYLSQCEDIQVIGEASTGKKCLQLFDQKSPDVCLLDIEMPQKNGLDVVRAIRKKDEDIKLLILSMHSDTETIEKAFKAGINGYLKKDAPKNEIAEAIRTIYTGKRVGDDLRTNTSNASSKKVNQLTNRELEILQLVVKGYSSPQIANKLYISSRTVDTHRNNMMKKLDISNTASLVRYALQHKLVELP